MTKPSELPFDLSEHAKHVLRERAIPPEWVKATLASPARTEPDQTDPELTHALGAIEQAQGRVLRVVYNHTRTPPLVVTAFFDRAMRGTL